MSRVEECLEPDAMHISARFGGAELALMARRLVSEWGWARLAGLPILDSTAQAASPEATWIALPAWATDLGVGEPPGLLAPVHCLLPGEGELWRRVDWWRAVEEFAGCAAERDHEARNGPVHSYAWRLPEAFGDGRFDHAWVNRILLFLRRWWAFENDADEVAAFGPVPPPRVHLTHDVDAVSKALPIRLKQAGFAGVNAVRQIARACPRRALDQLGRCIRFGIMPGDYWRFDELDQLERAHARRSSFNFHAGPPLWRRSPHGWLLDPPYTVERRRVAAEIRRLADGGHAIGLHPGFANWRGAEAIAAEKARLEAVVERPVTRVRQHWLRFSFADTWPAQRRAGLDLDMTLGFNDRPGFRASAALPLPVPQAPGLTAMPLVLMDSHLHDYGMMEPARRRATIDCVLEELRVTGGEASVVWHQRVFHPDYGWGEDYAYLLRRLDEIGAEPGEDTP